MSYLRMIIDQEAANEYLKENDLEEGFVVVETIMPQYMGMTSGETAVLLVVEIDGNKVIAKASLQMLEAACKAMRAGTERFAASLKRQS